MTTSNTSILFRQNELTTIENLVRMVRENKEVSILPSLPYGVSVHPEAIRKLSEQIQGLNKQIQKTGMTPELGEALMTNRTLFHGLIDMAVKLPDILQKKLDVIKEDLARLPEIIGAIYNSERKQ